MSIGLIIFLIVLFIVALLGTFFAFKQEEDKMKKYEEEGSTVEDEIKRSHEYEQHWLKSGLPLQLVIYTITIVVSLIVFAVYIF